MRSLSVGEVEHTDEVAALRGVRREATILDVHEVSSICRCGALDSLTDHINRDTTSSPLVDLRIGTAGESP
jgi:hypothetical protein